MKSLFTIQQDMMNILFQIEEMDGEITPEIAKELEITQANLAEKGKSYLEVIKSLDEKINAAKEESTRIAKFKKSKEHLRKRLGDSLVEAINLFGDTAKNGTHYLEGATYKIMARPSKSIELNEILIQEIINQFKSYCNELYDNNVLGIDDLDLSLIASYITMNIIQDDSKEYLLFAGTDEETNKRNYYTITKYDLLAIKVSIKGDINLFKLAIKDSSKLIETIIDFEDTFTLIDATDKTSVKAKLIDTPMVIANECINYSLNIK